MHSSPKATNINDQWKSMNPTFQTQLREYVISNNTEKFDTFTQELGFTDTQKEVLFDAIQISIANDNNSNNKPNKKRHRNDANKNNYKKYHIFDSSSEESDSEFSDYGKNIQPNKKQKLNNETITYWTLREENKLMQLTSNTKNAKLDWNKISKSFPNRTANGLKVKYYKIKNHGYKNVWTRDKENKLMELTSNINNEKTNINYWMNLSISFPNRSIFELRKKWYELHKQNSNNNSNNKRKLLAWTVIEENKFISLVQNEQREEINWEYLVGQFPNRTIDSLKSKYWELYVKPNKVKKKIASRRSSRIKHVQKTSIQNHQRQQFFVTSGISNKIDIIIKNRWDINNGIYNDDINKLYEEYGNNYEKDGFNVLLQEFIETVPERIVKQWDIKHRDDALHDESTWVCKVCSMVVEDEKDGNNLDIPHPACEICFEWYHVKCIGIDARILANRKNIFLCSTHSGTGKFVTKLKTKFKY